MTSKASQLRENPQHWPRWMTDEELRAYFGLSERALNRLHIDGRFPTKNVLTNKTDSKAVDRYFDEMSGLVEGGRSWSTESARAYERLK